MLYRDVTYDADADADAESSRLWSDVQRHLQRELESRYLDVQYQISALDSQFQRESPLYRAGLVARLAELDSCIADLSRRMLGGE